MRKKKLRKRSYLYSNCYKILRSIVTVLTRLKYALILGYRQLSLFILYLLSVMRKIEREMIQAIIERRNFKKGNTEVIKKSDYMGIYLHGNLIAKYGIEDSRGLKITHCDWLTNTTKSRLNAIIKFVVGGLYGIYQEDFRWYLKLKNVVLDITHIYTYDGFVDVTEPN